MAGVFKDTPNDPIPYADAKRMLESHGCPECRSSETYLTEGDVDGVTARIVICDACGHAIVADPIDT